MTIAYRNIARVVAPHGIKGEVTAEPLRGLPFLLHEGMTVALTPPALNRDRFCRVISTDEASGLTAFSGIDSLDAAEGIAGCYVLARADEVEHPPAHFALGGAGSPLDGQRGALGVAVARKARLCGARKFSDRTIGMSRIAHGGILAHTAPVRTGGDKTAFPSPFSPLSRPFSPAFAAGRGGLTTGREIKCISN